VGGAIRIATYNVQHGRRPDGEVDVPALAAACASLGADVLALQEVDVFSPRSGDVDEAAAVADATGMEVAFGESLSWADGGRYGNALLVRGSLRDVEVRHHEVRPGAEPRTAILATADVDGFGPMSVAATHLGLEGEAVDQLPSLVATLCRRPAPQALLGDLNLALGDVRRLVEPSLWWVASVAPWPVHRPRKQLDHVAVGGLVVEAIDVVALGVSDHRALVVDVVPG
jgi:endonuclease/exonuclease/phosphatase family metal-dependent hydrolase